MAEDKLEIEGMDLELQSLPGVAGRLASFNPDEIKNDPGFGKLVRRSRTYLDKLLDRAIERLDRKGD